VASFEQEITGCNRERFFARLAQDGFTAGFEEAFNGFADIGQRGRSIRMVPALTLAVRFPSLC
jgi:hypothetical protein